MSRNTLPSASASGRTAGRGTRPQRKGPGTLGRFRLFAQRHIARPARWWNALGAPDRVMYRAVGFLGCGFALTPWPALALITPGVLFALAYFGLSFRRGA